MGLLKLSAAHAAASSSAVPPISPISTTASVSGSSSNAARQSMNPGAADRVAAYADAGSLTLADAHSLSHRLVGQVPDLEMIPILPLAWISRALFRPYTRPARRV
ncbi:MAG: hypothetical protein Ct9H300mP30_5170 [Methanobacteriota archaeon]|nr:MAG: hypothetical protein Ct9H300mP30_5170 [Euryarchaeota archaeon]